MAPELPEAFVLHHTAGRIRLRVKGKKGDAIFFARAGEILSRLEGVEAARANPETGSIIVTFAAGAGQMAGAVAEYARSQALFSLKDMAPAASGIHQTISEAFREIDRKLRAVMGNDMDTAAVAFLTLAGMGIYQISRGNFAAPAWYTAFWYAMNIFLKSQPDKGEKR